MKKAEEAEKEKATELEDLIMVLSDLEEKRSKDKVCSSLFIRGTHCCDKARSVDDGWLTNAKIGTAQSSWGGSVG